jgi:hypothetical protein
MHRSTKASHAAVGALSAGKASPSTASRTDAPSPSPSPWARAASASRPAPSAPCRSTRTTTTRVPDASRACVTPAGISAIDAVRGSPSADHVNGAPSVTTSCTAWWAWASAEKDAPSYTTRPGPSTRVLTSFGPIGETRGQAPSARYYPTVSRNERSRFSDTRRGRFGLGTLGTQNQEVGPHRASREPVAAEDSVLR